MKRFHWKKETVCKAIRTFSLSVGATAVCMLASLRFLPAQAAPEALEASGFNGGKPYTAAAAPQAETGEPRKVVPLGSAFGIKLFTDGIIVASLSEIYTENGACCPARDAGIRPGDYVLEADGQPLSGNGSLAAIIGSSQGKPMAFKIRRDDRVFETTLTPVYGEGSFKTGMWIRDSAAGIGTLTFYDPASGAFAGLGHGICDMDAGGVMSLKSGQPAPITLCGIVRGEADHPGQLQGYFSSDQAMGTLLANNETGVYGLLDQPPAGEAVEVLPREQVKTGPVQLLVTLDEEGPKLYEGQIERVGAKNQKTKNLVVRVTDPRLLALTGGIVQGMSGCPILQDGKLAGAVTHVFTDEPAVGYGIFAETMCEEITTCGVSK